MAASKCTDASKEGKLAVAIVFARVQGIELQLSANLQTHLDSCQSCRERLPEWEEKAKATVRAQKSYDIVNQSGAGDTTILTKTGTSGTAYFKPYEGENRGLLVLVDSNNVIFDPEEITLDQFEHLAV